MSVFLGVLFLVVASVGFSQVSAADYSNASEINSGRSGDVPVRYIKSFNNQCLVVEVLDVKREVEVLDRLNLCSFEGKDFSTEYADVGFQDLSFGQDGLQFVLSITPLEPTGEQLRRCVVPIKGKVLGSLKCFERLK